MEPEPSIALPSRRSLTSESTRRRYQAARSLKSPTAVREASLYPEELDELVAVGQPDVLALLLAGVEDEHRGHAADAVLRADGRGLVDVELADLDLALELVGELLHDGSERTAGAAPGGPEVDEHRHRGLEDP